jgi:hypothetical protein
MSDKLESSARCSSPSLRSSSSSSLTLRCPSLVTEFKSKSCILANWTRIRTRVPPKSDSIVRELWLTFLYTISIQRRLYWSFANTTPPLTATSTSNRPRGACRIIYSSGRLANGNSVEPNPETLDDVACRSGQTWLPHVKKFNHLIFHWYDCVWGRFSEI